ncbi:unnamed protein product, partial [Mycena citricolor]
ISTHNKQRRFDTVIRRGGQRAEHSPCLRRRISDDVWPHLSDQTFTFGLIESRDRPRSADAVLFVYAKNKSKVL